MQVFAGVWGPRNTSRGERVFFGRGLGERKIQSEVLVTLSLSSNSEENGRLDVSLGPADVWGRRGDLVLERPTGGEEDLDGFWMLGADTPNWEVGEFEAEAWLRLGDLDLDRKGLLLSFNLAKANCRSDWLVEAIMTSRSPISMVSGPVWGEKTHNLDGQVSKIRRPGGQIATYAEANIEFDADQARSHCFTDGPTVSFPQGPSSSDGLGEYASGIKGKFECLRLDNRC